jgi:solute carrier family 10 (sodium/bile acid cotransporter), member 7
MSSPFWKKNWFTIGLVGVTLLTIVDGPGITTTPALWLKARHATDVIIVLIFFFSGLAVNASQIRAGIADYRGTLLALLLIFIVAPLLALAITLVPLPTGVVLGLFLVAAMPTTLSSGVVMTARAGGNMAHALLITIIANSLAVLTIPITLDLLLATAGESREIAIDRLPIMIQIATLVLLPLLAGMITRNRGDRLVRPLMPYLAILNQSGILLVVWMAAAAGRQTIVAALDAILPVLLTVSILHIALVLAALLLTRLAGCGKGRRESVILMGGQKTLAISVVLQVSLFPEYGLALVVCMAHHIIHLLMDAFLVDYLQRSAPVEPSR